MMTRHAAFRTSLRASLAVPLILASACTGTLSPDSESSSRTTTGSSSGVATPYGVGFDEEGQCIDPEGCEFPPAGVLHLSRLTHAQWGRSVRDIFELPTIPEVTGSFTADANSSRFSTNNQNLKVQETLWIDYERGAETVAKDVATVESLDRLAPSRDRDGFLARFGRRCYRRDLTEQELSRYQTLFDQGPDLIGSGDAFADGVELFVRACLQSPHFLYRTELADGPLSGQEIATRLSLSLWGTTPPDDLLDKSPSLETTEGLTDEIKAMLVDPRARESFRNFHSELLHLSDYEGIIKDKERYPHFTTETPGYLVEETQRFLEDVIFELQGGYQDVLTSPHSFVNADLADVYGITGDFNESFQRVDLDPNERAGLLTRLGFLSKNADAFKQDPIHRGVSVAADITCTDIPPPPDNIEIPDELGGDTLREQIDSLTSAPSCASCHHDYINPVGFAFGNYDGDGSFMTEDAGIPVDASGSFPLDGDTVQFNNAIEFSARLAESKQVHRCYSEHLLQYFAGRPIDAGDQLSLDDAAARSLSGELGVLDILQTLLLSEGAFTRPPLN